MNDETLRLAAIAGTLWLVGFIVSCLGYYYHYRNLEPTFWRVVAAIFWPIGIPLDVLYRRRR